MFRFMMAGVILLLVSAGQAATLKDFDGNKKSIKDFQQKGKWQVVMIWAHDCHVCNEEAHNYVKFHKERKDKDVTLLGVSVDGQSKISKAKSFISRHKLNFPNLIGEPRDVVNMYMELTGENTFGTPSFLVYTPKGELVAGQVGGIPPVLIDAFIKDYKKQASTK